ncbi:helix-turn-helix domain-containing protein [Amycolatopsis anabasis]|uniref:helix-turn-helix domain-containing protein n=1 Tax=Amycolatopsis anabasis TaxID=1840409 RepID=UPI00131C0F39|nr:helix-turn-helix domain-containing protein [Amycolatopsis anabasis]
MADDLQEIVDDLAERLQRSVAIDDPSIRLLAASRHFGDEDSVRVSSVLNRSIDADLQEQVLAQGIAQWTSPGRLVVPVAGTRPRLCVPVRCAGLLLGYLWLIDSGSSLDEHHQELAREAAERAGVVLYRRLVVHERTKARHEAILWELVSSDRALRSQAVEDLRAEQLFPAGATRFQVIGVRHPGPDGVAAPQDVALESAVEDARSLLIQGCALMAASKSRAWLVLARREPPSRTEIDAICARLVARFDRLTGDGGQLVLGVGGVVDRVEHVADSYRQAFLAARAARLVPSLGPVARWRELGPYELLLQMPVDDLVAASRVPALVALECEAGHRGFVATLETFLDNAGDVARTAQQLSVHRATLYHRLKRIEQLTGCALSRGEDRLTLHLGLKMRRLAAGYHAETTSAPAEGEPPRIRSVS